jgi:hypothetical protein
VKEIYFMVMNEELLQYIWKYKLYIKKQYTTSTGEQVTIIKPGEQNSNSGPDFSDARIKIGETTWAGNCEVHICASDWLKHSHTNDNSYNNTILHVVLKNDVEIKAGNGRIIPAIELEYDKRIEENYKHLFESQQWIACSENIKKVDKIFLTQWFTKLMFERLEKRSDDIIKYLDSSKNNWDEAFYRFLAKSFGFKVNSVPFEMLTKAAPLKVLTLHRDNLHQVESILFGQAGLLTKTDDEYSKMLLTEHNFQKKKYDLKPMEAHVWKFMRIRPNNFPTIRISQFANLLCKSSGLFSKIIECKSISELENLFKVSASEYWNTHYNFGVKSPNKVKTLSSSSIQIILINSVIPFIFVYGKLKNIPDLKDRAINLLEKLPPEKNNIIEKWSISGIIPVNAFETQALLQLKNEYCNKRNCLNCSIGNKIIGNV